MKPEYSFGIAAVFAGISGIVLAFIVVEPRNSELIKTSIRDTHRKTTVIEKTVTEKLLFTLHVSW